MPRKDGIIENGTENENEEEEVVEYEQSLAYRIKDQERDARLNRDPQTLHTYLLNRVTYDDIIKDAGKEPENIRFDRDEFNQKKENRRSDKAFMSFLDSLDSDKTMELIEDPTGIEKEMKAWEKREDRVTAPPVTLSARMSKKLKDVKGMTDKSIMVDDIAFILACQMLYDDDGYTPDTIYSYPDDNSYTVPRRLLHSHREAIKETPGFYRMLDHMSVKDLHKAVEEPSVLREYWEMHQREFFKEMEQYREEERVRRQALLDEIEGKRKAQAEAGTYTQKIKALQEQVKNTPDMDEYDLTKILTEVIANYQASCKREDDDKFEYADLPSDELRAKLNRYVIPDEGETTAEDLLRDYNLEKPHLMQERDEKLADKLSNEIAVFGLSLTTLTKNKSNQELIDLINDPAKAAKAYDDADIQTYRRSSRTYTSERNRIEISNRLRAERDAEARRRRAADKEAAKKIFEAEKDIKVRSEMEARALVEETNAKFGVKLKNSFWMLESDKPFPPQDAKELAGLINYAPKGFKEAGSITLARYHMTAWYLGVKGGSIADLSKKTTKEIGEMFGEFMKDARKHPLNGPEAEKLSQEELKKNIRWYADMHAKARKKVDKMKYPSADKLGTIDSIKEQRYGEFAFLRYINSLYLNNGQIKLNPDNPQKLTKDDVQNTYEAQFNKTTSFEVANRNAQRENLMTVMLNTIAVSTKPTLRQRMATKVLLEGPWKKRTCGLTLDNHSYTAEYEFADLKKAFKAVKDEKFFDFTDEECCDILNTPLNELKTKNRSLYAKTVNAIHSRLPVDPDCEFSKEAEHETVVQQFVQELEKEELKQIEYERQRKFAQKEQEERERKLIEARDRKIKEHNDSYQKAIDDMAVNKHYELFDLPKLPHGRHPSELDLYKIDAQTLEAYDKAFDKVFAPLMETQDIEPRFKEFDASFDSLIGDMLGRFGVKGYKGDQKLQTLNDVVADLGPAHKAKINGEHRPGRYAKLIALHMMMSGDAGVKLYFRPVKYTPYGWIKTEVGVETDVYQEICPLSRERAPQEIDEARKNAKKIEDPAAKVKTAVKEETAAETLASDLPAFDAFLKESKSTQAKAKNENKTAVFNGEKFILTIQQKENYIKDIKRLYNRVDELNALKKKNVEGLEPEIELTEHKIANARHQLEKADSNVLDRVDAEVAQMRKEKAERAKKARKVDMEAFKSAHEKKNASAVKPENKDTDQKNQNDFEKADENIGRIQRSGSFSLKKGLKDAEDNLKAHQEAENEQNHEKNEYIKKNLKPIQGQVDTIIRTDVKTGNAQGNEEIDQALLTGEITTQELQTLQSMKSGLETKHRGLSTWLHIGSGASHELQALKDHIDTLMEVTKRLNAHKQTTEKDKILRDTLVKKLGEAAENYMTKKDKGNPNWKSKFNMGAKRYQAAKDIKDFVENYKKKYKLTYAIDDPPFNQMVADNLDSKQWLERIKLSVNDAAKPQTVEEQKRHIKELSKSVAGCLAAIQLKLAAQNNPNMTQEDMNESFVKTAETLAGSKPYEKLIRSVSGKTAWEKALNIKKKAMKNDGMQLFNDLAKVKTALEKEKVKAPTASAHTVKQSKASNSINKSNK